MTALKSDKEKAIELVEAYFDNKKDVIMKDPDAGVPYWVSVHHPEYWSFLSEFCKNLDKYKIVEEVK